MSFVHLHNHSYHSLLDGVPSPEDYAKRAAELGHRYLAITDHGNIDASLSLQSSCKKLGITPVFGCEFYIVDDISVKERGEKRKHITVLAKNKIGWKNILSMISQSYIKGHYYRPRIDPYMLTGHLDGLIILSGCALTFLDSDWGPRAMGNLFENGFPREDFYLEVMPHQFDIQVEANKMCVRIAEEQGLSLIATNDNHYCLKGDDRSHEVLLAVQTKSKMSDPTRWKFIDTSFYFKTRTEMAIGFREQGVLKYEQYMQAIKNTVEVAEKCRDFSEIEKREICLPRVPEFKDKDQISVLKELCEKGFKEKITAEDKDESVYRARLKEELELIIKQGFVEYFLIVWEVIQWCEKEDIMTGPGRGSSAGSLVCYLLNITKVDPIEYGLIFARFINVARQDLPDIDSDFEDKKRPLIKKHLQKIYGEWNVSSISTFSVMRGKSALRDVSRVFDISLFDVNKACNVVVTKLKGEEGSNTTIRDAFEMFEEGKEFARKYPEVAKISTTLEGTVRQRGQHASAVIVSNDNLLESDRMSYVTGKNKEFIVNWEKDDAEYMGLMKLDILGLNALTVLNMCRKLIKENHGIDINYDKIDLKDEECLTEFNKGNTVGCFQLGTSGLRKFCQRVGIDCFRDVVDSTSLYRPGTLHCVVGSTEISCWNKNKVRIDEVDLGRPIISSARVETGGYKFIRNKIKVVKETGTKGVFELKDSNGNIIQATKKHKFWVKKIRQPMRSTAKSTLFKRPDWVELENISVGDKVLVKAIHHTEKQRKQTKIFEERGKSTRFVNSHKPWNKGMKNFMDYSHNPTTGKRKEFFIENWKKKMFFPEKWKQTIEKIRKTKIKKWENLELRKKHSERMIKYYETNSHPNEKGINISKPQKKIYEEVKKYFLDAQIEYRFNYLDEKNRKRFFNLDVVILEKKINVEFDGDYWHKNPGERTEPRDSILEADGWKVIRVTYSTLDSFLNSVINLTDDNNTEYSIVESIEYKGKEKTFDIMTENQNFPNYIANNFIVHNSGMADLYIKRKHGEEEIPGQHQIIEEITADTYGVVLYQEQMMWIIYRVAGLEWKVVDKIRKIVGKSKGVEAFKQYEEQFVEGCAKQKTLSEADAKKLFNDLSSFGSYSFNLAHAVCYTVITFWTMWAKTCYANEFMCSLLSCNDDKDKKNEYIEEAFRLGIDLRPPKVGKSRPSEWCIVDGILYAPFIEIAGVGDKTAFGFGKLNLQGFYDKNDKKPVSQRFLGILDTINAYKDEKLTDDEADRINEFLGVSLIKNKLHKYKKLFNFIREGTDITQIKDIGLNEVFTDKRFYMGIITDMKMNYFTNKSGEKVSNVSIILKDEHADCKIGFDYRFYERWKAEIEDCKDEYVIVTASAPRRAGALICDGIWQINDLMTADIDELKPDFVRKSRFRNRKLSDCEKCPLHLECRAPVLPNSGKNNIMIVGEAPNKEDDSDGTFFSGRNGQTLWKELSKFGLKPDDFHVTSVGKCFPRQSKTLGKGHIKACSPWLDEEIKNLKPFIILAFGNSSIKFFTDDESGIMARSGKIEWSEKYRCWICWSIHPISTIYNDENVRAFQQAIEKFSLKVKNFGLF